MSENPDKQSEKTGMITDSTTDHIDVNDGLIPDNIADLKTNSTEQQLNADAIKKATEPLESRTAKSANKLK
ncbi:MAG: hypothetical protein ABJB11_03210 [Ferruginibacter sp.]